jgi:hypothetical protein
VGSIIKTWLAIVVIVDWIPTSPNADEGWTQGTAAADDNKRSNNQFINILLPITKSEAC